MRGYAQTVRGGIVVVRDISDWAGSRRFRERFHNRSNLGHSGIDSDTELRDAFNAGRVVGPRILAAGRKLITRGEYVQNLNPALADTILQQEFLLIDGRTDRSNDKPLRTP